MTESPRAAIVGGGMMGRWHADALKRTGGRVACVVDRSMEAAEALADRHRCEAFQDLESALARKPHVVHVCTPLDSHVPLCLQALEAGAHVVVEKPVAPTADEVDRILDAAARAGRIVVPVYQFLFQEGVLDALARKDRFGTLTHLRATALSAGAEGRGPAEADRIAVEILPHFLALASRFLDTPVSEVGLGVDRPGAGELLLTGSTEGVGISILTSMSSRPTRNTLDVFGTNASAHLDLYHGFASWEHGAPSRRHKILRPFLVPCSRFSRAASNLARRAFRREPAYPGLRELLRRTYDHALRGGPPPIEPEEVREITRAWHEISRSLRSDS